ncbi:hypothetical protein [Acidithiobacillus ferrivorans]|uniref:hypothetical protein n=1 Tax=Acidithiobacillus ferrivorans TaxID=160808 RepID=UPI0039DF6F11
MGPDGHRPERESHDEAVLKKRFEDAVARLNQGLVLVLWLRFFGTRILEFNRV